MEIISFDTFLLLVLLILVGIVLFLSLVITLYVIRLSRRITDLENNEIKAVETIPSRPGPKKVAGAAGPSPDAVLRPQEVKYPDKEEERRVFDASRDAPDIPTGMQNLCALYGLDSLTVSSPDGLVIASSGHLSSVTEAAQYSYAFQTGAPITDAGVHVFPLDFHATPLVGILRSPSAIPDSSLGSLQKDLETLLEKWI